jgi:hypothetical protein
MVRIKTAWLLVGLSLGACASDDAHPSESGRGDDPAEERSFVSELPAPGMSDAGVKALSGGASNTPLTYDDPDLKCYRLTSYAALDRRGEKYSVPNRPDLYVGFNIKAPWPGTQYIRSFRSIIDNRAALHHWILYRNLNGGDEGINEDVSGRHPDGEMLYGWAPGSLDLWFHPDVGMEVPGGSTFQLETHYNNRSGAPVPDASGLEICVTPHKPAHVAGLSFVGEDRISGTSAKGNCTHESKEPVRLIMGLPHMHKKGSHMKVDLTRAADGGVQTLHDRPFDFDYQRTYVLDDVVLQPGDKLTTTCTFSEPARQGKGTDDEMCYFFAIHWPAGALSRRNLFTQFHGPNTCIDL